MKLVVYKILHRVIGKIGSFAGSVDNIHGRFHTELGEKNILFDKLEGKL